MHVVEVSEFGGPEVLRPAERPDPVAGAGEVVVAISHATVNPSDLSARSGSTKQRVPDLPVPCVLGWDLAGTVAEVGEGVEGFERGDRVIGLIPWVPIRGRVGAYGEAAAVEQEWLAPIPDDLDLALAATLPLSGLTAAQGFDLLGAPAGARVLVTGASGAVGWFATQIALQAGCSVLALASDGDEEWVADLGAEVLSRGTDLRGIEPVDYVFDAVPLGPLATASLKEGGVAVFTRPPSEVAPRGRRFETVWVEPRSAMLKGLAEELARGNLRSRIAQVLALDDAAHAHALAERGGQRGKLVLATGR